MGKSFDKVLMGAAGTDGTYEIDQSLIFNSPSDTGLRRVPSTTGNRKTFTTSFWIKRTKPGHDDFLVSSGSGDGGLFTELRINSSNQLLLQDYNWVTSPGSTRAKKISNRLFRDSSAWQHWVWACDTTLSTAADRNRIYVNGVLQTSMSTDDIKAQDENTWVNYAGNSPVSGQTGYAFSMNIGFAYYYISNNAGYNFDGYMAEVHHIDGLAKAPTEFGKINEDTGQWIPKEYTGGSYGTNGYYLKFESGAIGTDSSGQGNDFTVLNLANADVVTDSPTNNFCTLNPLDSALPALLEGNTNTGTAGANSWKMARSTFELTTGKWYWEMKWTGNTVNSTNGYQMGLKTPTSTLTAAAEQAGSFAFQGVEIFLTAGSVNTVTISPGSATTGQNDIIMFAYDADAGKMWIGVNGTWTSSGNPAAGSNNQWASIPTTGVSPFAGIYGSNISIDSNFGQKTFAYTPPSGFKSLSTKNLPEPAIALPSAQFNTVVWTGNSTDNRVIPVGFAADLTWFKQRTGTNWHGLLDTVRGNSSPNVLHSNSTNAAGDWTYIFKGHTSTGFTVGTDAAVNANSNTYVAWNWKANGAGSTDTSGDIDAVVSANQAAGFSIITWTGDGGGHTTVPHGLGVAPEIIFEKYRNGTSHWYIWVTAIDGTNDYLLLNTTAAAGDAGASGTPTSQFFSNWGSSATNVAYAFVSIPGFSKIGVYTGNGNADGPFVNTGFKPAWVMIKRTDAVSSWSIYDSKRSISNVSDNLVWADLASAEGTSTQYSVDILSNGFKLRDGNSNSQNINNGVFLYMAFAESPFKTATAH